MTMKNWPIGTGEDGVQVNVTATSQAVALVTGDDNRKLISEDVMIDNPGPNDVFVKAGNAATTATDLSMRVPAGSLQPFRKGNTTHIALKCKAGLTQTVVVHVGEGQ